MIRVCFDQSGSACRLSLRGHATGDPAVCAAASALIFALAGYVHSRGNGETELDSGRARVECGRDREADGAFAATLSGLEQLQRRYPQLVAVSYGGRAEGNTNTL